MKRLVYVILLVGLLLWLVPSLLRDSEVPFGGAAAYVAADDAVQLRSGIIIDGSRVGSMSAIVAFSGAEPLVALRVLGLLAGLAGGVGLWLMLRGLQFPHVTALVALSLYAVSSLSLSLFAVPSGLGFAVGFAMLAAGLLLQSSLLLASLGMFSAMIAALVSPVACLHTIAMCCGILLWQRKGWRALVVAAALLAVSLIVWQGVPRMQFEWVTPVIGVLAELGKPPGLGAMDMVIAVLGIACVLTSARFVVIAAVVYASVTTVGAAFALPLWVSLGAIELVWLYQRQWRVKIMRLDTLLFITLAILLATFMVGAGIVKSEPTPLLVGGLGMLKASDTALVHDSVAPYAWYWSEAKVVIGTDDVWYGRDIHNTTVKLGAQGIGTIVITRHMREGLVWDREEEGMLFLLENSDMFTRQFVNDELEIWGFAPQSRG
jgi:hypothetical protein